MPLEKASPQVEENGADSAEPVTSVDGFEIGEGEDPWLLTINVTMMRL